jgi:hypothetical protein
VATADLFKIRRHFPGAVLIDPSAGGDQRREGKKILSTLKKKYYVIN